MGVTVSLSEMERSHSISIHIRLVQVHTSIGRGFMLAPNPTFAHAHKIYPVLSPYPVLSTSS